MVLQAEEMKEDLKLMVEKRLEKVQKKANSTKTRVKYNIIKSLDWCFRPNINIYAFTVLIFIFYICLCVYFRNPIMLAPPLILLIFSAIYMIGWLFTLCAKSINRILFFFQKFF
jgi:predicted RND superfamily exporter protein